MKSRKSGYDKRFREDIQMWEIICHARTGKRFFQYSIWRDGKLYFSNTVNQRRRNTVRYVECYVPPIIQIGRAEFLKLYHKNKWLVPMNRELNLSKP